MYLILGIILGVALANLVLLLYSRAEQVITRYLDRTTQNKEKATFLEPVSPEETINNIFNENE